MVPIIRCMVVTVTVMVKVHILFTQKLVQAVRQFLSLYIEYPMDKVPHIGDKSDCNAKQVYII